jgi:hypothetical protein
MAAARRINAYDQEIDLELLSRLDRTDRTGRTPAAKSRTTSLTNKNYSWEHFNVTLCTDETTNIFINIINKTTYQNYESNIKNEDLDPTMDISKFIRIVYACFESKPNYSLKYRLESETMELHFTVCFDEFYQVSQSIVLPEKAIDQDKQSSAKIIELETRIKELETREIVLGYDSTAYGSFIKIKKDVQIIDFRAWADQKFKWYGNLWEFSNFQNLKKIIINDNQWGYNYQPVILTACQSGKIVTSNTQICNSGYTMSCNVSTVLPNMFDNPQMYFPNVREIVIYSTSTLDFNAFKFRSLPNLTKVTFEQYVDKQITGTFALIKANGIRHMVYNNCLNIDELELIKNYFATNNFRLEITKK